jgi:hypothetical protein
MSIGKMKDIRYPYVIIEVNYLAMEKEDTVIKELTDIFILAGTFYNLSWFQENR